MTINERISEINSLVRDQCWYITRQVTDFGQLCYAAKILEEYKQGATSDNFENYFRAQASIYGLSSPVHRQTNNCYYLGLLKKINFNYESAEHTSIYYEIKSRCGGNFFNRVSYQDLINTQIEKLYISNSALEERSNQLRDRYKIHPSFFLVKVLLLVGDVTGDYSISLAEFYKFVGTSFTYNYYVSTVECILEARGGNVALQSITTDRFSGNRLHLLLSELPYFEITLNTIKLNAQYILVLRQKIAAYESTVTDYHFTEEFLTSVENFEIIDFNEVIPHNLNYVRDQNNGNTSGDYDCKDFDLSVLENVPRNKIFYGAPGTGKSFRLQNIVFSQLGFRESNIRRVTFHPSYNYQQFIGAYKPTPVYKSLVNDPELLYRADKRSVLEGDNKLEPLIDYTFVAGPLLELLVLAIKAERSKSRCCYMLIIEEINRANVASVFGDVFQLLDRSSTHESVYQITFNTDIKNYLIENEVLIPGISEKIGLPSNLFIWATMNNADQGVMPLDAAFKRRWSFEYIGLNSAEIEPGFLFHDRIIKFRNKCYNWNSFRKSINLKLKEQKISEDKLIGFFFMSEIELINPEYVKNKLLLYLRDDVLKHKPDILFPSDNLGTFSDIIEKYDDLNISNQNFLLINWSSSSLIEIDCLLVSSKGKSQDDDFEDLDDFTESENKEIEILKEQSLKMTFKDLDALDSNYYKHGALRIFTLSDSTRFCLKISKINDANNGFWFGITPKVFETMISEGVKTLVFVLAGRGYIKFPVDILYSLKENLGYTLSKGNPQKVSHYHISITGLDQNIALVGRGGFRKDLNTFYKPFTFDS